MLPVLAKLDPAGGKLAGDFDALEKSMSRPSPDPRQIAAQVRDALPHAADLVKAMENAKYDAPALGSLRASLTEAAAHAKVLRWDEAEQLALALGALGRNDAALAKLFDALAFPSGYESPAQGQADGGRRRAMEKAIEELPRDQ